MKAWAGQLALGLSVAALSGTIGFASKVQSHMANDGLHVAGVEKRLESMEQQLRDLDTQQREMLRLLGKLEGVNDGRNQEDSRSRDGSHRPQR